MNSQQELLDAINTISQKKERSFDTPATVLRVEGDTVWVHIDGGADETPCQKTINCEEGETVQVRISNGSAFLVGNASAPPTDDKTANVAHFVAEQADEKATDAEEKAVEAIRSVEAISQTVEGKVDSGDSNVTDLSSTMYQNANGVNIYNDTLAVGDTYAHIDGDSFDIKEVTSAGTIDDANDKTVASFGAESVIRSEEQIDENNTRYSRFVFGPYGLNVAAGIAEMLGSGYEMDLRSGVMTFSLGSGRRAMRFGYNVIHDGNPDYLTALWPDLDSFIHYSFGDLFLHGNLQIGTGVLDIDGNKICPTILTSSSISAATTSYTFTDDAIKADSVVDIYDTIFGFTPSNAQTSAGSCVITFPAQSSSHKIKIFVY